MGVPSPDLHDLKLEGYAPEFFPFSDHEFAALAALAYERSGLTLGAHKRPLVYGRLVRRLRALQLESFGAYIDFLRSADGAEELEQFTNRLTTNHTAFFREPHHIRHVTDFIGQARSGGRVRIWSAGCSTGEEPYSIGLAFQAAGLLKPGKDIKILATDIDSEVLEIAAWGTYRGTDKEKFPPDIAPLLDAAPQQGVQMPREVRGIIHFRRLNLLEPWPMSGPFDAIFCRNVMIYFDDATRARLVSRLSALLRPGGYLYVGHSESLRGYDAGLTFCGRTTYRKESG